MLFSSFSIIFGLLTWDNYYFLLFPALTFLLLLFLSTIRKFIFLIILFFLIGLFQGYLFYKNYPLLNRLQNNPIILYGKIIEVKPKNFIIKSSKIINLSTGKKYPIKENILIYYTKRNKLKIVKNQIIKLRTILKFPKQLNPYTFNYLNYLKSKQIKIIGKLYSKKDLKVLGGEYNFLTKYKTYLSKKINNTIKEKEIKNLLKGIILGDKSSFSSKLKELLSLTGTSHIFTISGLHMGIFFIFVLFIFRFLTLPINNYYLPIILTLPFLLFYLLLTGNSFPSIRAFLIVVLGIWALFAKRYKNPIKILFFIFFLITFFIPYSFFNIGLQYSFIIVFFILIYVEQKNKYNFKIHPLLNFFLIILICFLSSLPLSVYHFSKFYLNGLFANIFIIPLYSFIIIPLSILWIFFPIKFLLNIIAFFIKFSLNLLIKLPYLKAIFIKKFSVFELGLIYSIIFLSIYLIIFLITSEKIKLIKSLIMLLICTIIFIISYSNHKNLNSNKLILIKSLKNHTIILKNPSNKYNLLISSNLSPNFINFSLIPILINNNIKIINSLIINNYYYNQNQVNNFINTLKKYITLKKFFLNNCYKNKFNKNISIKSKSFFVKMIFPPKDKFYLLDKNNTTPVFYIYFYGKKIIIGKNFTEKLYDYLKNKFHFKKNFYILFNKYLTTINNKFIFIINKRFTEFRNGKEIYFKEKGLKSLLLEYSSIL